MASKEIFISRSGGLQDIIDGSTDKAIEYFVNASNDISFALIKYRKSNNMTQADLAQKLGFSQAMVSKLESCEYNFTIELLSNICAKLDWNFRIVPEPYSLTVRMEKQGPVTMQALKAGNRAFYHASWGNPTITIQKSQDFDNKIA